MRCSCRFFLSHRGGSLVPRVLYLISQQEQNPDREESAGSPQRPNNTPSWMGVIDGGLWEHQGPAASTEAKGRGTKKEQEGVRGSVGSFPGAIPETAFLLRPLELQLLHPKEKRKPRCAVQGPPSPESPGPSRALVPAPQDGLPAVRGSAGPNGMYFSHMHHRRVR